MGGLIGGSGAMIGGGMGSMGALSDTDTPRGYSSAFVGIGLDVSVGIRGLTSCKGGAPQSASSGLRQRQGRRGSPKQRSHDAEVAEAAQALTKVELSSPDHGVESLGRSLSAEDVVNKFRRLLDDRRRLESAEDRLSKLEKQNMELTMDNLELRSQAVLASVAPVHPIALRDEAEALQARIAAHPAGKGGSPVRCTSRKGASMDVAPYLDEDRAAPAHLRSTGSVRVLTPALPLEHLSPRGLLAGHRTPKLAHLHSPSGSVRVLTARPGTASVRRPDDGAGVVVVHRARSESPGGRAAWLAAAAGPGSAVRTPRTPMVGPPASPLLSPRQLGNSGSVLLHVRSSAPNLTPRVSATARSPAIVALAPQVAPGQHVVGVPRVPRP